MLEVRVFEASRIFQAKTQHAIKADVCDPDQGKGQELAVGGKNGKGDQHSRCEESVNEVVDTSADADVGEIPQHGKIRRKKECCKKHPAELVVPVNQNTQRKNGHAFKTDENGGFSKHGLIVARDVRATRDRTFGAVDAPDTAIT